MPAAPYGTNDSGELYEVVSHGRGGVGNIGEDITEPESEAFSHLTSPVYTTGHCGTGNMALNDPKHPEYAHAAHDVELPTPLRSCTDFHGGRDGAGNVYHPDEEESMAAKLRGEEEKNTKTRPPPVDHSKIDYRGWADKGKDLLFGRSKNNR
ncbi:hypothetical protein L211DRAFT_848679 [Terfezia boudieri ATCC MYA-4762]|uniref:Uncharacterized protein n=1 Tax=Terfezia boudieri ATCC MYA-4762 TaxID=1051890 RepID=A0A3N4LPN0_9PEZI|nr:hypothetical protein L211DRAFT_848679 [Terfezia boudieri ATCC MYA-4762]